jgi:hypothetical protein
MFFRINTRSCKDVKIGNVVADFAAERIREPLSKGERVSMATGVLGK